MRGLSTLILLLWVVAPAWARRPAASSAGTRAMVAAGRQALAAQDFATSLERLEQAYVLAPSPDLLYELGQVARGQGRTLAAVDLLRRYLEEAHRFMDPAGQREAEALIAAPRKASGEVAVARERGALLWLDDSWRAPCPYHCLCW